MTGSTNQTDKNQMRTVCLETNTSTSSITSTVCVQGNAPGDLSDFTSSFQLFKKGLSKVIVLSIGEGRTDALEDNLSQLF